AWEETRPLAWSQASKGEAGSGRIAARSRCSRSPIVSLSPRSRSPWRLRHCSSSHRLNASQVANRGMATQEVAAGIAHKTFDTALVIALAGAAIPIPDQIVGQKPAEQRCPLARAVRKNFCHQAAVVVVNDRLRHGPQEGKCVGMAVHPCPGHGSRISPDIAGVAVGQIEHEKVRLLFHPADDNYSLPKVRLAMPGRMGQRHKHFLTAPLPLAHVVLDDRVAAGKSMFITQPVKYPLGRMA